MAWYNLLPDAQSLRNSILRHIVPVHTQDFQIHFQIGRRPQIGNVTVDGLPWAAANGRRAHHRCSMHGCPWRMDFSRALALFMASRGRATSISFFLWVILSPNYFGWFSQKIRWISDENTCSNEKQNLTIKEKHQTIIWQFNSSGSLYRCIPGYGLTITTDRLTISWRISITIQEPPGG